MPGAGMNNVGSRALGNGTLQWKLEPRPGFVNARIQFTPTAAIAAISKTIAFVQTVSTADTTGGFLGLFSTTYRSSTEVDVLPGERDPFYGAQWNAPAGTWGDGPAPPRPGPATTRDRAARARGAVPPRRPRRARC